MNWETADPTAVKAAQPGDETAVGGVWGHMRGEGWVCTS
jgi:hypothetical protein